LRRPTGAGSDPFRRLKAMEKRTQEPGSSGFLRAEEVALTFPGGARALEGASFALRRGEFASLVGPSGCGKSTLLRLAAGLLAPSSGQVVVDGVSAEQARRDRQELAVVFQQPNLLPWRTVAANAALPLEMRGMASREAAERVAEALELVGLADFASALPHQLSGGMQMRASLARALAAKPQLLLLDEPFGALDEITRQKLNEDLLRLWRRDGWTALFVTHNVFEAAFLSERVLVMSPRPGRIAAEIAAPFPFPRSPELRSTAEYARLAGEISQRLRGEEAA
jgi:NitT/TauT family transport system ATP-binding protein